MLSASLAPLKGYKLFRDPRALSNALGLPQPRALRSLNNLITRLEAVIKLTPDFIYNIFLLIDLSQSNTCMDTDSASCYFIMDLTINILDSHMFSPWTLCKIIKNYSKLLTLRGLGAQCLKHASVLLI